MQAMSMHRYAAARTLATAHTHTHTIFPLAAFYLACPLGCVSRSLIDPTTLLSRWLAHDVASFMSTRKARYAVVGSIRACHLRLGFRHLLTSCDVKPINNLKCAITSDFIDFSSNG
ncbi:hypothetical protein M433DRAFT_236508 [Acidomyces richmondensis BFW]|nr:MAG: hypothetical protein FE78DRAFT_380698 [Acidomyces sp. 'richmondensis']KYG45830.1 hypothetical protein M433DRAFT_236508 [Acidomyces richmondensis BFW]